MTNTIEKISKIPLREIWKNEARDFTTWLQDNTDVLKEVIGIELFNVEKEQSTGNFNVDLLGEDSSGNVVIIENQLEKSDHDHLGKIITYLTAFEAKKAIWIVAEPRQEHANAISWLNETTNCDFFLIKIEAIRIGHSNAAPLLTLIIGPSELSREAASTKKDISERHQLRYKFWAQLLERSKEKHSLFSSISPTEYNWIGASSGTRGVSYTYWITKAGMRIEIYIDRGKESDEENLWIFSQLKENKDSIEQAFGSELEWLELEENRSCIIRKEFSSGGWRSDESEWPAIHDEAIEGMVKLENATRSYINKLNLSKHGA